MPPSAMPTVPDAPRPADRPAEATPPAPTPPAPAAPRDQAARQLREHADRLRAGADRYRARAAELDTHADRLDAQVDQLEAGRPLAEVERPARDRIRDLEERALRGPRAEALEVLRALRDAPGTLAEFFRHTPGGHPRGRDELVALAARAELDVTIPPTATYLQARALIGQALDRQETP